MVRGVGVRGGGRGVCLESEKKKETPRRARARLSVLPGGWVGGGADLALAFSLTEGTLRPPARGAPRCPPRTPSVWATGRTHTHTRMCVCVCVPRMRAPPRPYLVS